MSVFRSSHKQCILKNFSKFTGKQLCWSLFLIKLKACSFIKKRLQHMCFLSILQNFSEHIFYRISLDDCFSMFEKDRENFFTKYIICNICSVQLMFADTADVFSFNQPFSNWFLFLQKPFYPSMTSITFLKSST